MESGRLGDGVDECPQQVGTRSVLRWNRWTVFGAADKFCVWLECR